MIHQVRRPQRLCLLYVDEEHRVDEEHICGARARAYAASFWMSLARISSTHARPVRNPRCRSVEQTNEWTLKKEDRVRANDAVWREQNPVLKRASRADTKQKKDTKG